MDAICKYFGYCDNADCKSKLCFYDAGRLENGKKARCYLSFQFHEIITNIIEIPIGGLTKLLEKLKDITSSDNKDLPTNLYFL